MIYINFINLNINIEDNIFFTIKNHKQKFTFIFHYNTIRKILFKK